jgi:hypothetical protein
MARQIMKQQRWLSELQRTKISLHLKVLDI